MAKNLRITIIKWLILIALIAYMTGMAIWANKRAMNKKCEGIEVCIDGTQFMGDTITRKGIISELARFDKNIMSKQISQINTLSIENYLSRFSNFEKVECAITSTGRLRINVVPMIPEIRIFDGASSYYINIDGKRIDANAKFFTDVPIVSGKFSDKFPASKIIPLAKYINSHPELAALVMMIKVDSPNNIILIPRITGHVINIGDTENLPRKFNNLMLAYRDIMPYKGWQTYDTISVKYLSRIIATRRDKTLLNHTPEYEQSIDFDEDAAASSITGENTLPSADISRKTKADAPLTTHQQYDNTSAETPQKENNKQKKTDDKPEKQTNIKKSKPAE